jgi:two-component system phosphate regulon sensor histidine kinase PhoR
MPTIEPWGFVWLLVVAAAVALVRIATHRAAAIATCRSALVRAEDAVAAAAARLHDEEVQSALIDRVLLDGIILVDGDNRVVRVSPRVEEWFGSLTLLPQARPTVMAAFRSTDLVAAVDAARAGESSSFRVARGERVFDGRAEPGMGGAVAVRLTDVTALDRLSRARRDLVANVSHDLRTPLTSIGLLAEALAGSAVPQGGTAKVAADIAEQVAALTDLADGLLDLERLESGQAIFRLEPVALRLLVQHAASSLQPQLDQKGLRLVVDVSPSVRVLADAPHVLRVLTNLLDNAAGHSPEGGAIRVSSRPAGDTDRVEVCVRDHGPGFAPGDLPRVFERFYRGDRARAGSGAGLGLAIARHVVEGHGGVITAQNAPDGGAAVCLTLPIA